MNLAIRPMTRADLDVALGWARDEGWNPGLDDSEAFHAQDPTGFLMGWLNDQPIGCISVVKYDASFAFLGLYIVRPDRRGQGYGKAIWDAGIVSAGSRTIGLDGVVVQQDNYRKSGFAPSHENVRWGGAVAEVPVTDRRIAAVSPQVLPAIEAFDRTFFPAPRPLFLSRWLASTPLRQSLCVIDGANVLGYGTIRRCIEGFKIGPLFARTPAIAGSLFNALTASTNGALVFVDIPATNSRATELARGAGLAMSFQTARMYRGIPPDLLADGTYGISSLELG